MKYAKNSPNKRSEIRAALISWSLLWALTISTVFIVLLSGCTTTVTPRASISSQASWDGTNQNSGFLQFEGVTGVITPHARDRYNGLIEIYGKKFVPPILHDYGVWPYIGGNYIISPQALTYFVQMNRWHKWTTHN